MSDIVERLRERPCRYANETEDQAKERRQREREEGANEIDRLRAEVKAALDLAERHMEEKHRLRAALREIAAAWEEPGTSTIARTALGEKP